MVELGPHPPGGSLALWTQSSQRLFRFDVFEVDLWTGELRKEGAKLKVQDQPLKVLAMLLARPGELVTREQLREGLWSDDTFVDFDRGLNTAVNRLRSALNDSAETPRFVETVASRGYRFIAPVKTNGSGKTVAAAEHSGSPVHDWSEAAEMLPSGSRPTDIAFAQSPSRILARKWNGVAATLLLVAAGATGYGAYRWRSHSAPLPDFMSLRMSKLTSSGRAEDVAISPDGSYVVYSQRGQQGVGLWLHHIATSSKTQILPSEDVDFRGLTFSPDGNSIYFVRTRKEIGSFKDLYAMPMLGGLAQLLAKDIDTPVSFSPDGRQFVYLEGFGPPYGNKIRIANADGSGNRVLATLTGTSSNFQAGPAWSPDGRTVVVSLMLVGDRAGFVLDSISLLNGTVRQVFWHPGVIGRPLWLPDSETALAELDDPAGQGQLWAISLREGKKRRITNDLANWGIRIEATRDAHTVSAIQWSVVANLWLAPAANLLKTRQITDGKLPMIAAVARPDGKILAVSGNDEIWVMNGDGTEFTPFSSLHDVAPPVMCGSFVVTTSYSIGAVATAKAGPDTLKTTKLASGRLIVQRSYQSGLAEIMRVDQDGLNPTKLAGGLLYSPTCSPDGKFVFYISMGAPQRIMRVPIQGGDSQIVGDVPGPTVRGTMRVSPDGRFLAFPFDQERPKPLSKLAIVSARTGETVKTFDAPGAIYRESCLRWSPDGKGLQYLLTKGDVTNIWDQPISGGPPHQVTKFTTGRIFDFNWTADGELLLSRGEVTSDVVLLSALR